MMHFQRKNPSEAGQMSSPHTVTIINAGHSKIRSNSEVKTNSRMNHIEDTKVTRMIDTYGGPFSNKKAEGDLTTNMRNIGLDYQKTQLTMPNNHMRNQPTIGATFESSQIPTSSLLNYSDKQFSVAPIVGGAIFSSISMQPDKKPMKGKVISGSKNAESLIEADTLTRILEIQKEKADNSTWLDVGHIGVAGIPSLWVPTQKLVQDKQIPRYLMRLLEKYHKIYVVLRSHKRWEQERMFGKSGGPNISSVQYNQPDYQLFTEKKLISKYKQNDDLSGAIGQTSSVPLLTQYQKSFSSVSNYSQVNTINTLHNPHLINFETDPVQYNILTDPKLVRQVLETNAANELPDNVQRTTPENCSLIWSCNGLNSKPQLYQHLLEHQKINHFLNSTELTRKDRLTANFMHKRKIHGAEEFNYLPETYELPAQLDQFKNAFLENQRRLEMQEIRQTGITLHKPQPKQKPGKHETRSRLGQHDQTHTKHKNTGGMYKDNIWIVKPSSSSRGRGIFLLTDLSDVPKDEPHVVSKYISNPLLVSGYKFDVRLYVLVTSIDPMRVYIYNEGLVRFASEPYSHSEKGSKFSHLTNYSINKNNASFVQNKNTSEQDVGNKWSLSALQAHFKNLGIDLDLMWGKIYDAILKSLISVENTLFESSKKYQTNTSSVKSNFFELFGYDFLLDSDLNPWLLEVNLAPSLTADSPIDFHVKSNLIVDMLNLVGLRRLPGKRTGRKPSKVKPHPNDKESPFYNQTTGGVAMSAKNSQSQLPREMVNTRGREFGSKQPSVTQLPEYRQNMQSNTGTIYNQGAAATAQPFYDGIEINLLEKISKISAKHRSVLIEVLSELERNVRLNFTRVYPAAGTQHYDRFFEAVRPNNRLVYKYLFEKTELSSIVDLSVFNDLHKLKQFDKDAQRRAQKQAELEAEAALADTDSDLERQQEAHPPLLTELNSTVQNNTASVDENEIGESQRCDSNMVMNITQANRQDLVADELTPVHIPMSDRAGTPTNVLNLKREQGTPVRPTYYHNQSAEQRLQELDRSQAATFTLASLAAKNKSPERYEIDIIESDDGGTPQRHQFSGLRSPEPEADKLPSLAKKHIQLPELDKKITEINQAIATESFDASNGHQTEKLSTREKPEVTPQKSKIKKMGTFDERRKSKSKKPRAASKDPGTLSAMKTTEEAKTETTLITEPDKTRATEASVTPSEGPSKQSKLVTTKSSKQSDLTDTTPTKPTKVKRNDSVLSVAEKVEKPEEAKDKKKKVVITGDDILIEYVRRTKNTIKKLDQIIEEAQKPSQESKSKTSYIPSKVQRCLENFAHHKAWQVTGSDSTSQSPTKSHQSVFNSATFLWQKLHVRYVQMRDQRDFVYKNQRIQAQDFDVVQAEKVIKLRDEIVRSLSSIQLEAMVMKSNQHGPLEIVSLLAGNQVENSGGNLSIVEKCLKRVQINIQEPDNLLGRQSSNKISQKVDTEPDASSQMTAYQLTTQYAAKLSEKKVHAPPSAYTKHGASGMIGRKQASMLPQDGAEMKYATPQHRAVIKPNEGLSEHQSQMIISNKKQTPIVVPVSKGLHNSASNDKSKFFNESQIPIWSAKIPAKPVQKPYHNRQSLPAQNSLTLQPATHFQHIVTDLVTPQNVPISIQPTIVHPYRAATLQKIKPSQATELYPKQPNDDKQSPINDEIHAQKKRVVSKKPSSTNNIPSAKVQRVPIVGINRKLLQAQSAAKSSIVTQQSEAFDNELNKAQRKYKKKDTKTNTYAQALSLPKITGANQQQSNHNNLY